MVELLEGCGLYEETTDPVLLARVKIINLLGASAVTKRRGRTYMSEQEKAAVAARKTIRAFAVHIGAVTQTASYRKKEHELLTAINTVKDDNGDPMYPTIAEMENEEIEALMGKSKSSAPSKPGRKKVEDKKPDEPAPEKQAEEKAKPAASRRRSRKPKDQPALEPEKAEEKEVAEKAPKKPAAGRRRSRKPAEESDTVADTKQLQLLTDMVKDIGLMVQEQGERLNTLNSAIADEELSDRVVRIEAFLCWFYNAEFAEGKGTISSLDEISWT
jgi:hypothetical protein